MKDIKRISLGLVVASYALLTAGCFAQGEHIERSETAQQATAAFLGAEAWPSITSPLPKDEILEARVANLLSKMSVEEKVGQIIQAEIQYTTPADVRKYHLGSVLNGGGSLPNRNKHASPGEWLAMADAYYDASMDTSDGKLAIPIIWGSDAVHGHNNVIGATIFPHNIGLGAMRDPALMREIGRVTAREMRVTGIDWTFAPTLAVVQNDRWGRTYESYSEDPAVVRSYAGELVYGLQGEPGSEDFLDVDHVVATAKHFVGDGGTEGGDDQGDARVSEAELRDIHAQGYVSALEAGVQTAMASFSSWNGAKLHGHKYLLTDVLKGQMGLDGFVVGDWNGHGQVPGCSNASCAAAFNAGVDLFMAIEDWKDLYRNTLKQVKSGIIPMKRLDDAVSRILRVKIRAGLFEKGRPSQRGIAGSDGIIGSAEHRDVARRAVRKSLVLIKNERNVLPLQPGQNVLVAGDGADNIGKQTGGWTITWQGTGNENSDFPGGTSILDGLQEAIRASGGQVQYNKDGKFTERPDVAIVVFGEDPYAEYQGDLETLEFEPGKKHALTLLEKFKDEGIPVVSVFLSGRPLWVNREINASDAFVAAWLPGSEGIGVADVLVADASGAPRFDFEGKLSFSWPATPLQDVLNPHHEQYAPLFPLGYGLTYAKGGNGPGVLAETAAGMHSGEITQIALYDGRPLAPYAVYVNSLEGVAILMSGPYAAHASGALSARTAAFKVQEDAIEVNFSGEQPGVIFIGGPELDLGDFLQDGVLSFMVRQDQPAGGDMRITLGDRSLSIRSHMSSVVGHGWQRLAVKLSCFAAGDNSLLTVNEPFRLESEGPAVISFANIYFEQQGASTLECP